MFDQVFRSWKLFTGSFRVLVHDQRLLWFPILSLICTLAAAASFFAPMSGIAGFARPTHPAKEDSTSYALVFLFYFVQYFITIFFNTALVAAAGKFLDGAPATVSDGLHVAIRRLGRIANWALLATTVAMLLALVRRRGPAGRVASGVLGTAWSLITYFVVPVIAFENRPVWEAVDRSKALCRRAWGEEAMGSIGFGVIWLLVSIPGLLIGFAALQTHSLPGAAVAIVYLLVVAAFSGSTKGIFTAALYRYAVNSDSPNWFSGDALSGIFAGTVADDHKIAAQPVEGTLVDVSVIPLEKGMERGELYSMRIAAGSVEYHASYALEELSSKFRADSWEPGTRLRLQIDGEQLLISGPGCPSLACRFTTAAVARPF